MTDLGVEYLVLETDPGDKGSAEDKIKKPFV